MKNDEPPHHAKDLPEGEFLESVMNFYRLG
jgi:hypothetical protein